MLKVVLNFLQRRIVTEEVWVRKLRIALKLKMGMREAENILIPMRIPMFPILFFL
jgi:hypothetical protein